MAIQDVAKEGQYILSYLGFEDIPDTRYPSERHFIKSDVKKDVIGLLKGYYETSGIHVSDRTCTALAVVTETLEHHNYSYDLNDLLITFDTSLDSFDRESHKVRIYSNKYYWQDSPKFWNISGNVMETQE